jgi:tripartite-type tricarboxylate transporter receptor subunit TctC
MPRFAGMLIGCLLFHGAGAAHAQKFPERPVRIVTSGVGGGADVVTRLILPQLAAGLGQPVSVDNQAVGITPIQMVSKAPPDGHVLLVYSSTLWIGPLMQPMAYDAVRDFAPVAWLSSAPNIVVVHPSLPVRTIAQLLALAKKKPGMLSYGTSGAGGSTHLAGEMLKAGAGVNITHVPYRGNPAALKDLLAGQVQIMFSNAGSITPYVKAGRVRALAVTSAEPSALFPGLPTVSASGLPGYETASIIGLFAPAATPAATVGRLNQEVERVLGQPETRARFLAAGLEPVGGPPDRLVAAMKREIERLGKVVREAGIRAE